MSPDQLCPDCARIGNIFRDLTTISLTKKGDIFDGPTTHLYPDGGTIPCCRLSSRDVYRIQASYGVTIHIRRGGRSHLYPQKPRPLA